MDQEESSQGIGDSCVLPQPPSPQAHLPFHLPALCAHAGDTVTHPPLQQPHDTRATPSTQPTTAPLPAAADQNHTTHIPLAVRRLLPYNEPGIGET